MPPHYRVHLSDEHHVEIHAEKINLGDRKLCFYDKEDNLQALFRWDSIQGFSVEGSASGQILIEELPHENKAGGDKVDSLETTHGPIIALLESVHQALGKAENALDIGLVRMHAAKGNKSETKLLVQQRENDIRRYQAQLADHQQSMERVTRRLMEEVASLFKPET